MTTLGEVLKDAKRRITSISTSASLDAQLLLAEVLSVGRAHIIAHPEKTLTDAQAEQIESLIQRREQGEPIAYILGRQAFYDREFIVTPAVLIPRPETEHLLEAALDFLQAQPDAVCVDVGTGSGALAVTVAARTAATVYATDVSLDALEVARRNAAQHQADVTFFQGDLLQPLIDHAIRVDLVISNPPYIATGEMRDLDVSRHEPHLALDGGADGLVIIRRLLQQLPSVCNEGALVLIEIGADQGGAMLDLVRRQLNPAEVGLIQDYAGHDRVVRIQL